MPPLTSAPRDPALLDFEQAGEGVGDVVDVVDNPLSRLSATTPRQCRNPDLNGGGLPWLRDVVNYINLLEVLGDQTVFSMSR